MFNVQLLELSFGGGGGELREVVRKVRFRNTIQTACES